MTDNFEARKNMQAATITAAVLGLILVLLLIVGWETPQAPPPVVDQGLEVNLGSSDMGLGNDQPFQPGPPAAKDEQRYTPPKPVVAEKEEVKDPETNDKDPDAPVIKKPVISKPNATKIAEKEPVKKTPKKVMPKADPVPQPPRPKTLMPKGINGTSPTGGNDASTYKKGGNEGIAGGKGDQGQPGGNPDSKNYVGGGHGNSGVTIRNGLEGRYIAHAYNYQGDFNENAKVSVDVVVDKSGNVISATYQVKGSTTSDAAYREKAIEIIRKSKLNANPNGEDEQRGTLTVDFRVKN
ncbi:MAG TPA: hypothetical protein VGM41_17520 [Chitinophagaceae bacterium]|jgi:hypothetical protein